jgi:membrane protein implicated in regulation of membrane protease activity
VTALYLFAAAAGVPLVAWSLLGGGDDAGDDGAGTDDGVGALMLRLLPLSTVAIALAAFGVCGLVLGAAGTAAGTTLLGASAVALVAGALNSTVFSYLRRSESGATTSDADLAGAVGRVVQPVAPDHRGRIALSSGDQRRYLSARALPDAGGAPLEVGTPVLVVEVRGGVASVTRLDPELTDDVHDPGAHRP